MRHLWKASTFSGFNAEVNSRFPASYFKCDCARQISDAIAKFPYEDALVFVCDSAINSIKVSGKSSLAIGSNNPLLSWAESYELVTPLINHDNILIARCFLENVSDPRTLLRAIKIASEGKEIEFTISGDSTHRSLRSWSNASLCEFLETLDLKTEMTSVSGQANILVSCAVRKEHKSEELTAENVKFLLVATEDARIESTGGIGTYTAMIAEQVSNVAILYVSPHKAPRARRSISIYDCIGEIEPDQLSDGMGLVEAIKVLLTVYPQISGLEIPDYKSLGYRVAQAREAGQLPKTLGLRVFLHGNVDYLKYQEANSDWSYSASELRSQVKDAKTFSGVDEVAAPTKFIENLMSLEFGYELASPRRVRLPFAVNNLPADREPFSRPNKIIFIGKFTRAKGWPDFIESIKLANLKGISEIHAYSPGQPNTSDKDFIEKNWKFVQEHLSHKDLIEKVQAFRKDSIFILPYKGDNHPFSVLEQALLGTRFVTYDAGGAPELIPASKNSHNFVSESNPGALAEGISNWLHMDVKKADEICEIQRELCVTIQKAINDEFIERFTNIEQRPSESGLSQPLTLDVVTPFYNTNVEFMDRLHKSLVNQTSCINSWIIVDDGSSPREAELLKNLIENRFSNFHIEVISQQNRGLAAARNTGLAASQADLVLFIDSDDVLASSGVEDAKTALQRNHKAIVYSGFGLYFTTDEDLEGSTGTIRRGVFHKPLGTEHARAIGFSRNDFMTSCAVFRRLEFLDASGWGPDSKATWEDWGTYLRLAWANQKFVFGPSVFFGYRYSPTSMSRTYNNYFGQRRLVASPAGMTKVDVNAFVNAFGAEEPKARRTEEVEVLVDLFTNTRLRSVATLLRLTRDRTPAPILRLIRRILS